MYGRGGGGGVPQQINIAVLSNSYLFMKGTQIKWPKILFKKQTPDP